MEPLTCEKCGGPMMTRRECPWCRTKYFEGPDLPDEPLDYFGMNTGTMMSSSTAVHMGYPNTATASNVVRVLAPWE